MAESGQESGEPQPLFRTISDMHREIAATPGARAHNAIELIRQFLYVFVGNAMELKQHLESLEQFEVSVAVTSNTPDFKEAGDAYHRELLRRFHNFASAVASLVDLTRNLVNEMYPSGDLRDEYERRIEPFKTNPRRRLVRQLRNYVLHNSLPPTTASASFQRAEGEGSQFAVQTTITLDHEVLLEHGKWDAEVVALLETDGGLDLLVLVDEYFEEVGDLYLWLIGAQLTLHQEEIDATNTLIERFKREVGQPPEWDPPASAAS